MFTDSVLHCYTPPGDGGDDRPRPRRPACSRWTGGCTVRPATGIRSFTCTNTKPVFTDKLYSQYKSEIYVKNIFVFPRAKCNVALVGARCDGASLGRRYRQTIWRPHTSKNKFLQLTCKTAPKHILSVFPTNAVMHSQRTVHNLFGVSELKINFLFFFSYF